MGIMGQVGELAGGLMGEVAAAQNDAQIQYLLKNWKQRYDEMPATERVKFSAVPRSELSSVSEREKYRQAEDMALDEMMKSAMSGGMTDRDKAKLVEAKLSGLDYERGVRGANEQSLRRRGMAGSGADVASSIAAEQGGIDRAYRGDVQTASDASDRALASLAAAGSFANKLGSRDLEQKNLTGMANDRITQFNAGRGDREDLYNSQAGRADWMTQNQGLDEQALAEMGMNDAWGQRSRQRYRGYGKQAGGLLDTASSMGGGGMGGMGGM